MFLWHKKDPLSLQILKESSNHAVYMAIDSHSGIPVGLKVYSRAKLSKMEEYNVYREIEIHARLHHAHIISLYAAWDEDDSICLAIELADQVMLLALPVTVSCLVDNLFILGSHGVT